MTTLGKGGPHTGEPASPGKRGEETTQGQHQDGTMRPQDSPPSTMKWRAGQSHRCERKPETPSRVPNINRIDQIHKDIHNNSKFPPIQVNITCSVVYTFYKLMYQLKVNKRKTI